MQREICSVLHAQLSFLLSADADSTALGQVLEPRVASFPIASQKDLIVVAHSLLHAPQEPLQVSPLLRSLLTQLLHVLSNSKAQAVADSALWALQQQQQLLLLQATPVSQHLSIPAASLPSWLVPSSRHCCSWLERQSSSQAARGLQHQPSAIPPLGKQYAPAPAGASISPPACGASGAGQVEQAAGDALPLHDSSPCCGRQQLVTDADAASMDTEHRPGKRARPNAAAGQADAAHGSPSRSTWSITLHQLQALVGGGDVKHLDLKAFAVTLAAAAAHDGGGRFDAADDSNVLSPGELQMQLQQHLQALPVDACHVLLEELLQQCSAGSSSSSSSCPDSSTGRLQFPDTSWALLLSYALLPHLQQLKGAASNVLLKCLTGLGCSSRCDVLVTSVLQPLVLSQHLKPVQVQLLVKLSRDVSSLQTRILQLVLVAAGSSSDAEQQPRVWQQSHGLLPRPPLTAMGTSHECCWSDPHAQLLKSLLEVAPQTVAQCLSGVVSALTAAVQRPGMATSAVFGQLLMSLVKQLSVSLNRHHVQQLQAVVARTNTFLSKALTVRLQQLEALHAGTLV